MLDPCTFAEREALPLFTPEVTPCSTPRSRSLEPDLKEQEEEIGVSMRLLGKGRGLVVDTGAGLRDLAVTASTGVASVAGSAASRAVDGASGLKGMTGETLGTLTQVAKRFAASGALAKRRAMTSLARLNGAVTRKYDSGARQTVVDLEEDHFATFSSKAELLDIPRRTAHTQTFTLQEGSQLRWEFRVRAADLGFSLRRRTMGVGGAVETDLIEAKRFDAGVGVAGEWTAPETAQVVACFDNTYSRLRAKSVLFNFLTVNIAALEDEEMTFLNETNIIDLAPTTPTAAQLLKQPDPTVCQLSVLKISDIQPERRPEGDTDTDDEDDFPLSSVPR